MTEQRIAIIIPTYNEGKYLSQFLKSLLKKINNYPNIKKIIVVDDGSKDNTGSILSAYKKNSFVQIVKHKNNRGKGAALRSGINTIKNNNFNAYIFMDADNQHDPVHLPAFIDSLKDNNIVFGYRELRKDTPFIRKIGNNIARFIFRNFFHIQRKDLLCGYMAFRKEVISDIQWHSDDYGIETELSAIVGLKRLPFKEVKINTIYLDTKKGVNLLQAFFIFLKIPYWYLKYDRSKIYLFFSFISAVIIFILLAYKAAFSVRTLIPNLEPYPDSFYYAVPAWNFVHGRGFNMSFLSYSVKQIVPPLYSLLLVPFFAIFQDVRSFYYANLLLMIGSIFFLTAIIKKLLGNRISDFLIIIFLLFLFVSNFYIYTLPSYLLAENVTIFIFIFSFYLLSSQVTKIKSIIGGSIGILLLLIKFSNLPLGVLFYFFYLLKISKKDNRKFFVYFFSSLAVFGSLFVTYVFTSHVFSGHKNLQAGSSFSISYFQNNFKFYLENLLGQGGKFLWFSEKMLSPVTAVLAMAGIIIGNFSPKTRFLLTYIFTYIFVLIGFMSFFYTYDTRFIIVLYPLIIILIAIFFHQITEKISPIFFLSSIIVILACMLLFKNFNQNTDERMIVTFKKQIGLNIRYKEDPWYYIAIKNFNEIFKEDQLKETYLGTLLPPYLVNFYTNNHYIYLPLTMDQDFFPGKDGLAEEMGINSIYGYYHKLLLSGNKVYMSNIFSNNLRQWQEAFLLLRQQFDSRLVKNGCLGTCDLYEITLKNQ